MVEPWRHLFAIGENSWNFCFNCHFQGFRWKTMWYFSTRVIWISIILIFFPFFTYRLSGNAQNVNRFSTSTVSCGSTWSLTTRHVGSIWIWRALLQSLDFMPIHSWLPIMNKCHLPTKSPWFSSRALFWQGIRKRKQQEMVGTEHVFSHKAAKFKCCPSCHRPRCPSWRKAGPLTLWPRRPSTTLARCVTPRSFTTTSTWDLTTPRYQDLIEPHECQVTLF